MAGIDASTITSLGTCRLVMPLSESTIARSGPFSYAAAMSASIATRWSAGSVSTALSTLAQPLRGSPPAAAMASPCSANTSAKNTSTA